MVEKKGGHGYDGVWGMKGVGQVRRDGYAGKDGSEHCLEEA